MLNTVQRIVISVAIVLVAVSFLVPPCYIKYANGKLPMGYVPLAQFKTKAESSLSQVLSIDSDVLYAQLTSITLITIGLILLFKDKK